MGVYCGFFLTHRCLWACFAVMRSSWSFTNSLVMKSIQSAEILSNASSLKSYFPTVTLPIVSTSQLPANGLSPLTLHVNILIILLNGNESRCLYSQHIRNNSNRPHVCCECYGIKVHNLRSNCREFSLKFVSKKVEKLPNSGVPKSTWSFCEGSYSRARPKSIILTRFPDSVRHKMFSGCNIVERECL